MYALVFIAMSSMAVSAPETAGDAPKDEVICKRVLDTDTGSNFRRRSKVCRPASDWAEIEAAKERTLRRARDSSATDPNREQTFSGAPN